MKIVVAEKVSAAAFEVLTSEPDWQVVGPDAVGTRLREEIGDADALLVRSAVKVDAALLENAGRLRVIGRAGIGVDNIDLEAATRKGIAVMNTPGANAVAVAEHTFSLALALARHLCRANELMHAAKWEKKSLQGSELRGKTLGILGLGRIGMEVARRGRAFAMRVLAHDPFVSSEVAQEEGITLLPLEEVLASADYVTLHMALTPQTTKLINTESLRKIKKGACLINCARGELVDEAALAAVLQSGHLAGAGLDVFAEEPPKSSPLLTLSNVIATPHIAGSTHEAQEAVGIQIAVQVKEFLLRGVMQNAVNVPSVSHEEYLELQPYIVLAERMGSFLAQASEGSPRAISLRYSGRISDVKTQLVRNAAVAGVLNAVLDEKANLVNAAALAEGRGIQVREAAAKPRPSGGSAESVITLELGTSAEHHVVKGAVLHGDSPRLLAVDGIDVEAPLQHNLIYLRNRDVPGVIGRVGTVLAEHGINIANFSLGREELAARAAESAHAAQVREAVALVHVDSEVPDAVLRELRTIAAVKLAKAIRL